ncbi:MAG: hypothetical protein ACHREM_23690, partial [Polyangiales bacterium]
MTTHAKDNEPDAWLSVAPDAPDAPGVPFPRVADDAFDPVLAEGEAFTEGRRKAAFAVLTGARLIAVVAAIGLACALRADLSFALAPSSPTLLSSKSPSGAFEVASNRFVQLDGVPGGVGAVEYRRPLRDGIFRLAPLVDRPDVFVELTIPEGTDPVRYVPPSSVSGRLVPLDEAGARFRNARALIEGATGHALPARVFMIEPGEAPSLRNSGAIVAILALCIGAIQLLGIAQSFRPSRR